MVSRDILNSHPIAHLKKEISKTNIKGYSKMKKTEIIELMMKTPARFSHIKKKEGPPPKEKKKVVVKQDSSKLEKIMKDRKKKAEPKKLAEPKADTEPKSSEEPKRPTPKKVVKKAEPKKKKWVVEFRNKEKRFRRDTKRFATQKEAKKWARENVENLDPDNIYIDE